MDRYERFLLRSYVANALRAGGTTRIRRPQQTLAAWLHDHAGLLGLPEPRIDREAVAEWGQGRVDRDTWTAFKPMLDRLARDEKEPAPSALEKRLRWLGQTLGLSRLDADILGLVVRFLIAGPVRGLVSALHDGMPVTDEIHMTMLATLLGRRTSAVQQRLTRSQPLRLLGLLEDRRGGDFSASRAVLRIARQDTTNPQRLTRALMGRCSKAELAWEDFAHLGPERVLAEHLLRAALARREQGIGILLHGGPGTGKTAFARTLAERLEVHAVFVGETDESDAEPSRNDRIAAYALARALAGRTGRTILVVDEADDVFTGVDEDDAESRRGSKVFMNRLVEKTEAPTIWITNNPERLGPAVMRRMTLAIRFPQPGRTVRRTILNRTLKRRKLRLPARDIERLVRIEAAPAILDSAVRAAKLTHGGADDVEVAARSIVRVLEGAEPPHLPEIEGLAFDPALCSADADLDVLTEQVARSRDLALSFCFYGLPGTGKSAFARHLAERLGVDVIEKRASDLLSMWVGETEKQIARAFEEAADRRAMLILDEADSLLRDRSGAQRSWEVTQVNEMLTWMERHPYPVACTTNLMESLDPATLRRFLFKVRFLPMTVSQAREAFRRTFGLEPPRSLDQLDPLTPGDFAVVARKARVLGETGPERLGRLLATEVQLKPGVARQRIGF